MRVAFLEPIGAFGGAERCLFDLMQSLREADPNIEIALICGSDGHLVEKSLAVGIRTKVIPMPKSLLELGDSGLRQRILSSAGLEFLAHAATALQNSLAYGKLVSEELEAFSPTVIHSNGIKFHVLSRIARFPRVPLILHLRDFLSIRPLASHALRWSAHRANHAIAISKAVAEEARRELRSLPVSIVYDAVNVHEFDLGAGRRADLDRLSGLSPADLRTIRIGLVATYAKWKGHELFLEAAARIIAQPFSIPVRFYIVGGPIYKTGGSQFTYSELVKKISTLGLADCIGLIPFQNQIAEVYRSLDIVVHASTKPEPFGRTIVEAMACGRPVIVSAAGGAAELFEDGVDGLGYTPGDVERLCANIQRLVHDPAERILMGQRGKDRVCRLYSTDRLGVEILNLYQMLCSRVILRH